MRTARSSQEALVPECGQRRIPVELTFRWKNARTDAHPSGDHTPTAKDAENPRITN